MPKRGTLADRFWPKVEKRGPDDCWWWKGSLSGGYGHLHHSMKDGKQVHIGAHRAALLIHGIDPGPLNVLHSCNNPACVNPRHLRPGTQEENVRDSIESGTFYWFDHVAGEKHYRAKVDNETVRRIRLMAEAGMSFPEIGKHFGLSVSFVHACVRFVKWRHVPPLQVVSSYPENVKRQPGCHKLTEEEVAEIRRLRALGKSVGFLAKQFGVSIATISLCARGLTWKRHDLAVPQQLRNPGISSR